MSRRRVWPAGSGAVRAALALGFALSLATCRDALDPGRPTRAPIAVAPILPSQAALADFGLAIDAVRFIVVRPAADTLADTTLALPPDSSELALDRSHEASCVRCGHGSLQGPDRLLQRHLAVLELLPPTAVENGAPFDEMPSRPLASVIEIHTKARQLRAWDVLTEAAG